MLDNQFEIHKYKFGKGLSAKIENLNDVKKYYGGSRNGEIVLVESSDIRDSDFGSGYTIKEYESLKSLDNTGGWKHSSIRLKPLSVDKSFKNINLVEDESVSLNVLWKFIRVL